MPLLRPGCTLVFLIVGLINCFMFDLSVLFISCLTAGGVYMDVLCHVCGLTSWNQKVANCCEPV